MEPDGGRSAQGATMQGYQQQPVVPAAPPQVQYTTVNMVAEPPRDHIIWSLFCFVYSNPFCLGLVALIFSVKARDRRMLGDLQGAQQYGSTARCLNIVSTVLVCLSVAIVIISTIIIMVAVQRGARRQSSYPPGY